MVKKSAAAALLVDDDDLVRWALAESLRDAGYTVCEARDRRQAMLAVSAAADPFDVVVLDYLLPDSCDLRFLRTLRERTPTSRVIMLTGYDTPDVMEGALALGACEVVSKPFDVAAVTARVRALSQSH